MTLVLRVELKVADGNSGKSMKLLPGRYELERVPNPCKTGRKDWLVVKGTRHGGTVDWWLSSTDGKEDCDVLILV